MLRRHRTKQAEVALKCGLKLPADGLVFPAHAMAIRLKGRELDPHALASPRVVSKRFKAAAARLGIELPPRSSMLVLRHTHVTQLLNVGVKPKVVSERLGHSSVSITLDVYTHAMPDIQQQAADVVGEILGSALGEDRVSGYSFDVLEKWVTNLDRREDLTPKKIFLTH